MDNDTNTEDEGGENEYNLDSGKLSKDVPAKLEPEVLVVPKKKAKAAAPVVASTPNVSSEAAETLKEKVAKAKASLPKAKPLLEGINAPRNTSDVVMFKQPTPTEAPKLTLTDQENKLIRETPENPQEIAAAAKTEPKLMPSSVVNRVGQKPNRIIKFIIALIVILILGFLAYKLYQWNLNRSAQNVPSDSEASENNAPASVDPSPGAPVETGASSTPSSASTTPVTASSTPPTTLTPTTQLKINSTSTGWLNFRSGPSLNDKIITKVYPGEVYTYTAHQADWYKITLPDGRIGWVNAKYITIQ